jgi:hypothetical protein
MKTPDFAWGLAQHIKLGRELQLNTDIPDQVKSFVDLSVFWSEHMLLTQGINPTAIHTTDFYLAHGCTVF